MLVAGVRRHDVASATTVIAVWTAILSIYLVAATSLGAVSSRTLARGAGLGVSAGAAWLAAVLVDPDVASSNGPAVLAIAAAAFGAGWGSRIAGLCAAATTAMLIALLIDGPLRALSPWVSNSAPPVYPPETVHRLVDSAGVWLLGCLLAAALSLVLLRPARTRLIFAAHEPAGRLP